MAVTIRDVANAAGVSPMAVSKVLHGKGANVRVGKDTADVIRKIAQDLQYQPNALARSFRLRRTNTIGLVFENWTRVSDGSQYFAHLLDGITSSAFPRGYAVTICPQLSNVSSGESLNDGRFDGLIWAKFESTRENLQVLERGRTPMVLLHASSPEITRRGVNTVCCENRQAMRQAVDHLVRLGHRRVAFVAPQEIEHNDETVFRIEGIRQAMKAHGLPFGDGDVLNWDYASEEFGDWWATKPPHTALTLRSESQAGTIYVEAAKFGVRVPDDLSIVGFDSTAYCETLSPKLTAISQPIEDMAHRATDLLLAIIEGRDHLPAADHVFPCGFDIRESTARPSLKAEEN
ncbi:MAG: LacI family DNA-binding transcriptional regulator [Chlorobia bacterium]|nr:LacI family DNA-binding transcriptional regulator [Fimbriimonadaceae bacterium]